MSETQQQHDSEGEHDIQSRELAYFLMNEMDNTLPGTLTRLPEILPGAAGTPEEAPHAFLAEVEGQPALVVVAVGVEALAALLVPGGVATYRLRELIGREMDARAAAGGDAAADLVVEEKGA